MHEQVEQRTAARRARSLDTCGVLAVVNGDGMRVLFEGLGARVLDGGATLNPSTYELLAGIHEVPAEEVVVLPNSPNVRMAAERAAELSREGRPGRPDALDGRRAWPPRSRWTPTHDAAHQRRRDGGDAAAACAPAASPRPPATTPRAASAAATRVGFIDEELVAWGEPGETLEVVLGELGREAELLTVIEGDGAPLDGDVVAGLAPDRRRARARARRPAGLVVARARPIAGPIGCSGRAPRGTTTTGHAARRIELAQHAAEQHAPHRPVAARAADAAGRPRARRARRARRRCRPRASRPVASRRPAGRPSALSSAARASSRTVARNASSASRPMTGAKTSARGATTV